MSLRTLIAAAFLLLAPSGVEASCTPFPQSNLLGNYTHPQVVAYVKNNHDGDWAPYIAQLEKFQVRLNDLMKNADTRYLTVRGGTVDVKSREFARFVYQSRQWLQVAQCLAGKNTQETILSLNDFSTAAGNSNAAESPSKEKTSDVSYADAKVAALDALLDKSRDEAIEAGRKSEILEIGNEVASLNVSPVTVKVTTLCEAGDTVFAVTNLGESWPNMGVISVYGQNGGEPKVVSAQRTRLDKGERKIIKVKRQHNPFGEISLAIEPSWYSRPLELDATANCL